MGKLGRSDPFMSKVAIVKGENPVEMTGEALKMVKADEVLSRDRSILKAELHKHETSIDGDHH